MNIKGIRSKSAIPNKKEEMFAADNYEFENYEQFMNEENLNLNKLASPLQMNKNPPAFKTTKNREEKTYAEILREKNELMGKDKFIYSPDKNQKFKNPQSEQIKSIDLTPVSKYTHGSGVNNVSNFSAHNPYSQHNPMTQKATLLKKSTIVSSNIQQTQSSQSMQQEMVRSHLKRLFEYYCQFGERMNVNFLKSHKYQKFAIDADILDSKLNKTRLELIFSAENKNKMKSQMDFDTFLNSLVKIAEYKFNHMRNDIMNKYSKKSNSTLQLLLKSNIWPLYERIFGVSVDGQINMDKSQINNDKSDIDNQIENVSINEKTNRKSSVGQDVSSLNVSINAKGSMMMGGSSAPPLLNVEELFLNSQLGDILSMIAPIMYEIYKVYFPWEISLSENENFLKDKSMKAYFVILKEYDLCPSLISKSTAFQIFQSETIASNQSDIFDSPELNEVYSNIFRNIEISTLGRSNNKSILGKYFTFLKFLKSICKIGDSGFEKMEFSNNGAVEIPNNSISSIPKKKLTSIEKICLGLERMELSDGFLSLQHKTSKTHSRKTTCIIPREILEKVKVAINSKFSEDENLRFQQSEDINDAKSAEMIEQNYRASKIRKSVLGNFKDLFEHTDYILQKYGNQLNSIYKFFCSFGDPLNTTYMKTNKFSKFLKEAGLIKTLSFNLPNQNMTSNTPINSLNTTSNGNIGIKMNDIDVIFFKLAGVSSSNMERSRGVSGSRLDQSQMSSLSRDRAMSPNISKRGTIINSNAKIDFNGFINSIEIISLQIFPNRNELEAIDYIVINHILPLLEKFTHKNNDTLISVNKEKNENRDFMDVLSVLYKSLSPVYKYYQNKNGYLTFELFLKFCSDFSIFPDLISKSKLNVYFKNTSSNVFTESGENEFIDQETFVDILAQCAFDIPYRTPQPDSIEKIILFVEKISQSEGSNKILKGLGHTRLPTGESLDLISTFKIYFPGYFKQHEEKKIGFFDALNHENENDEMY